MLGWNAINLYDLALETDGFYDGYDDKCNPTIMNEFAAAAFRFGHSLLKPQFAQVLKLIYLTSEPLICLQIITSSDAHIYHVTLEI